MSEVTIRQYQRTDLPFMVSMWQAADRPAFTECQIEKLLASSGGVLIAADETDDKPVGTVLWSHNGYRAYVWRLVVDHQSRNQGIASQLLSAVETEVFAAGFEKLGAEGCQ